jgi:putative hemolysin
MNKIEISNLLEIYDQIIFNKLPSIVKRGIILFLNKLLHITEINNIIELYRNKSGIDFIDELFEVLDISYTVSAKDLLKIPSEGKLLIVSNHPLGGVDGLILLKLISDVRSDVKIVVNELLLNIDNLKNYFLPFDIFSGKTQRGNIELIYKSLNNNEAIIVFPAGEVSRFGISGIQDKNWRKSVLQLSNKYKVPILPVYIHARNSIVFYIVSLLNKKLSIFLLPRELFNKKNKSFNISIGHHIPSAAFENRYHRSYNQIKLLRKHVHLIGRGKNGIYEVEKNVIHPIPRKTIKQQLDRCKVLGLTNDKKKIFLVDSFTSPDVLKEIGRLREITFRRVSEGTGKKIDLDKYDEFYKHIVLWDEIELDIVGSYRIGIGRTIMPTLGLKGFYTSELFNHSIQLENILSQSAEMGRSFIQAKYWNTSALDYLWQGLGVFLRDNPDIKYTFGGVSLSKTYSEEAKKNIIYFYQKWFGDSNYLSNAKNKYIISASDYSELRKTYLSKDYKSDLMILRNILKHLGYAIPTLYKQYTELCEQDGIKFIDFCIDPDFNDCVDALILVEIGKIKEDKKERYIYKRNRINNFLSDLKVQTA